MNGTSHPLMGVLAGGIVLVAGLGLVVQGTGGMEQLGWLLLAAGALGVVGNLLLRHAGRAEPGDRSGTDAPNADPS